MVMMLLIKSVTTLNVFTEFVMESDIPVRDPLLNTEVTVPDPLLNNFDNDSISDMFAGDLPQVRSLNKSC